MWCTPWGMRFKSWNRWVCNFFTKSEMSVMVEMCVFFFKLERALSLLKSQYIQSSTGIILSNAVKVQPDCWNEIFSRNIYIVCIHKIKLLLQHVINSLLFCLTGKQEDEEVAGGGAESPQGSGKGREEGAEEHEWPHMGWDESLRTWCAGSPPKALKTKQTLARARPLHTLSTHFHGFLCVTGRGCIC